MKTVGNQSQSLSVQYTIRVTGQRSQTFVINNAQWRDVGVYKCIAAIGSTLIEAEASLDVLSKLFGVDKVVLFNFHILPLQFL